MMKAYLLAIALWTSALSVVALADGDPKIQFDRTVWDFGKTSRVESVSGTFKFKNVGDGLLRILEPIPSCNCTVASLKPDTLRPGETGELSFVLNLGLSKANLEEHITIHSNDPRTTEVVLTLKVDYTPLYDITPTTLAPNIPEGGKETNQIITITRTDRKPPRVLKLHPSKPWITANREPGGGDDDTAVRFRVAIQPDGPPRRFVEYIHVYTAEETNGPTAAILVFGRVIEELSLSPEALSWSITDPAKTNPERAEALLTRRVTIRSGNGRAFELKNPEITLKGIKVTLVSKESGKAYELVAKLNEVPEQTMSGYVSFETSVPTQRKIEVPMIVTVPKR